MEPTNINLTSSFFISDGQKEFSLPEEVIKQIFDNLSVRDLFRVQQVSNAFASCVENNDTFKLYKKIIDTATGILRKYFVKIAKKSDEYSHLLSVKHAFQHYRSIEYPLIIQRLKNGQITYSYPEKKSMLEQISLSLPKFIQQTEEIGKLKILLNLKECRPINLKLDAMFTLDDEVAYGIHNFTVGYYPHPCKKFVKIEVPKNFTAKQVRHYQILEDRINEQFFYNKISEQRKAFSTEFKISLREEWKGDPLCELYLHITRSKLQWIWDETGPDGKILKNTKEI